MNLEQGIESFNPQLRKLLEVAATKLSPTPETQEARDSVDMFTLEERVTRLALGANIIVHAFEYMQRNPSAHPLNAFVHSTQCHEGLQGERPLSDREFFLLLIHWRQLCKTGV